MARCVYGHSYDSSHPDNLSAGFPRCLECMKTNVDILVPELNSKMIQMYSFPIDCPQDMFADITKAPDRSILPRKLISSVSSPGKCILNQLYIGGVECLIDTLDLYSVSTVLAAQLRKEFLEERGLTGKSSMEIDEYLEHYDLSIPDPCRIDLPTIGPGRNVRITGSFEESCVLTFIGLSL